MAKFGTNKNCPIKQCRKFTVEGSTDRDYLKEYLEHLGVKGVKIEVANGKGNVINNLKKEYDARSGQEDVNLDVVCFYVDGDEQGYYGVVQELIGNGIQGGVECPPYYIHRKRKIIVGVVGDPEKGFSGSPESLFLRGLGMEPTGNSQVDKKTFNKIKNRITKEDKQRIFDYIDSKYCPDSKYCLPDDEKDE